MKISPNKCSFGDKRDSNLQSSDIMEKILRLHRTSEVLFHFLFTLPIWMFSRFFLYFCARQKAIAIATREDIYF